MSVTHVRNPYSDTLGRLLATPEERFAVYCEEFARWKDRLGLHDWEVGHKRAETLAPSLAQVCYKLTSRVATTTLSDDMGDFEDHRREKNVRESAFHEACHLLLAPLNCMADEYVASDFVEREIHSVIHKIQVALFEPDWEARRRSAEVRDKLYRPMFAREITTTSEALAQHATARAKDDPEAGDDHRF